MSYSDIESSVSVGSSRTMNGEPLYIALGGIVQPAKQLYQSGFAAAVLAHKRHFLTDTPFQIYVLQHIVLAVGIFEINVLELKLVLVIVTFFCGDCSLVFFVGDVEKVENLLPHL